MARGTVKWFNSQKGYGFIHPDGGGGKDVFVHISAVEKAGLSGLNEGAKVSYDIVSDRGKESAGNLKVKRGARQAHLPGSNTSLAATFFALSIDFDSDTGWVIDHSETSAHALWAVALRWFDHEFFHQPITPF